jgi:6-phosphofructokinase 2
MPQIVTLTLNPAVDKISSVQQIVAERKLRCGQPRYDPGGGGLNVARAIRTLGGQATAYWPCGGPMGQLLAERLDTDGVSHRPIPVEAMTRENLIVLEQSTGQQFRFGMPGAKLTPDEVELFLHTLRELDPPPDFLVLSGSLPPGAPDDFYARAAEQSPAHCRVILDTSGTPLRQGIDGGVYLIKPNIRELSELAGRDLLEDAEIREVARGLIASGKVHVVVTSLGSAGVVMVTEQHCENIRAPTVKVRSKVGAGDSTVAGIVLGLAQETDILDAVRLGVAAGSAAVMTEGTELCRQEDAWRLYEAMSRSTGREP